MKKMTSRNIFFVLILVLTLSITLTACGSSGASSPAINENSIEEFKDNAFLENMDIDSNSDNQNSVAANRKIIEKYRKQVETKNFNELIVNLNKEIEKLGGYTEKSNIDTESQYRYANITIRIPRDASHTLNKFIDNNSNVVHSETETTDVTLEYVDVQSRIDSLRIEQEQLKQLLENATELDDIIRIQSRLTDVIYEIESNQSKLRVFDNLIDFTTIDLTITEVENETVVKELGVWERISRNLQYGFKDIWKFLKNLFVFLISSIPYLLLLGSFAIIVIVIVLICNKCYKKSKHKKMLKQAENPQQKIVEQKNGEQKQIHPQKPKN